MSFTRGNVPARFFTMLVTSLLSHILAGAVLVPGHGYVPTPMYSMAMKNACLGTTGRRRAGTDVHPGTVREEGEWSLLDCGSLVPARCCSLARSVVHPSL